MIKIASRIHTDGVCGIAKVQWDFAIYGGAVVVPEDGNGIELPLSLPKGAVIWNGVIDVITPLVCADPANTSANLLFKLTPPESVYGDFITTLATIGRKQISMTGVSASAIKLAGDRQLELFFIGTEPVTAGKFNLFLNYYLSD